MKRYLTILCLAVFAICSIASFNMACDAATEQTCGTEDSKEGKKEIKELFADPVATRIPHRSIESINTFLHLSLPFVTLSTFAPPPDQTA